MEITIFLRNVIMTGGGIVVMAIVFLALKRLGVLKNMEGLSEVFNVIDEDGDEDEDGDGDGDDHCQIFTASSLRLTNLHAGVTIDTRSDSGIGLSIYTDDDRRELYRATVENDVLTVTGGRRTPDAAEPKAAIKIWVPPGTAIALDGVSGEVEIEDIEGDVTATLVESESLLCGFVRNLTVTVGGNGVVTVTEVTDSISVTLTDQASVMIDDGEVTSLNVCVSGEASFSFEGTAAKANLTNSGSGDISVTEVTGSLNSSRTGRGDITIGD